MSKKFKGVKLYSLDGSEVCVNAGTGYVGDRFRNFVIFATSKEIGDYLSEIKSNE